MRHQHTRLHVKLQSLTFSTLLLSLQYQEFNKMILELQMTQLL